MTYMRDPHCSSELQSAVLTRLDAVERLGAERQDDAMDADLVGQGDKA